MKILIVIFGATVCGIASISASAQVGYVVDGNGTWVLNGSTALTQMSKLPAGGSIRRRSASNDDFIKIVYLSGKFLTGRECSIDDCSRPIRLPVREPSGTLYARARAFLVPVTEKIASWVLSDQRPGSDLNRGSKLSEAVAKLNGDKIDLSSVLKSEGEQYLRWRLVRQEIWSKPVRLDKPAIVSGFQPGLFEVNLVRSNGSNFEPIAAAWILVLEPSRYEKSRADFQQVSEVTKAWGNKVRPETTRLFLKAALENLAQNAADENPNVPKKTSKF